MKENKYDNPLFFQKYSEMSRSRLGLAGAGEWPALQSLLPDFTGQDVCWIWAAAMAGTVQYAAGARRGCGGGRGQLPPDALRRPPALHADDPHMRYRLVCHGGSAGLSSGLVSMWYISSLAFHYVADLSCPGRPTLPSGCAPAVSFVFSVGAPGLHLLWFAGLVVRCGRDDPPLSGGPLLL